MPMPPLQASIGIDGCPSGWIAATLRPAHRRPVITFQYAERLEPMLETLPRGIPIWVDIPIGLPDRRTPRRPCDLAARRMLSRASSSIFSPPARAALTASSLREAGDLNEVETGQRVSAQSFNIFKKIAEVDDLLRDQPALKQRLSESHPEIVFTALNGGKPMPAPKKRAEGRRQRTALLERWVAGSAETLEIAYPLYRRLSAPDDLIDALCLGVGASFPPCVCRRLPTDSIDKDAAGLPRQICYPSPRAQPLIAPGPAD